MSTKLSTLINNSVVEIMAETSSKNRAAHKRCSKLSAPDFWRETILSTSTMILAVFGDHAVGAKAGTRASEVALAAAVVKASILIDYSEQVRVDCKWAQTLTSALFKDKTEMFAQVDAQRGTLTGAEEIAAYVQQVDFDAIMARAREMRLVPNKLGEVEPIDEQEEAEAAQALQQAQAQVISLRDKAWADAQSVTSWALETLQGIHNDDEIRTVAYSKLVNIARTKFFERSHDIPWILNSLIANIGLALVFSSVKQMPTQDDLTLALASVLHDDEE